MKGLNKVMIIGRVGQIETKTAQNGMMVARFSVAVDDSYKDKQGNQVKQTEWFSCVAFNKLAEIIAQYVFKGHLIYVEGSLKTEKYTDKQGVEKTTTKLMVANVQFLQQKESSDTGSYQPKADTRQYQNKDNVTPFDDDIPF